MKTKVKQNKNKTKDSLDKVLLFKFEQHNKARMREPR